MTEFVIITGMAIAMLIAFLGVVTLLTWMVAGA